MTTRDLVNSPTVKLLAWGAAFGIAYATLQSQVSSKGEKADMVAADLRLENALKSLSQDVRVLRLVACQQAKADTFCKDQP